MSIHAPAIMRQARQRLVQAVLTVVPLRLVRGARKRMAFDYLGFGPSTRRGSDYIVEQFTESPGTHPGLRASVAAGFARVTEAYRRRPLLLRNYVVRCRDCFIEPDFGWAILAASDRLVFDSIANQGWLESYHPSWSAYRQHRSVAKRYPEVVSLRMLRGAESNYWHFFHDYLAQVLMARKYGLADKPLLIPRALADKPYFKGALARSAWLASRQWVIQEPGQYIHADEAYFLQNDQQTDFPFQELRELLGAPAAPHGPGRRVFLKRGSGRTRALANGAEIERIARAEGFEIVDTDGMSLDAQVELFADIRLLAAVHGAGLTNQLFRRGALDILEIFPRGYIQPHHHWLANSMGHGYDGLIGGSQQLDTTFMVPPQAFRQALRELAAKAQGGTAIDPPRADGRSNP